MESWKIRRLDRVRFIPDSTILMCCGILDEHKEIHLVNFTLFQGQQGRGRYGQRKTSSRPSQAIHAEADLRHASTYEEAERNKFIYGRHGYEARADSASSHRVHHSGSPAQRSRDG